MIRRDMYFLKFLRLSCAFDGYLPDFEWPRLLRHASLCLEFVETCYTKTWFSDTEIHFLICLEPGKPFLHRFTKPYFNSSLFSAKGTTRTLLKIWTGHAVCLYIHPSILSGVLYNSLRISFVNNNMIVQRNFWCLIRLSVIIGVH